MLDLTDYYSEKINKLLMDIDEGIEIIESEPNDCLQIAPEMGRNNHNEETVRAWEAKKDAWLKRVKG